MKEEKGTIDIHCFICERCSYETPLGPSKPDTAKSFRKSVKEKLKSKTDNPRIRVNASGCLGQCDQGISAVIYPSGRWLKNLRPGHEEEVIEKILKEKLK